MRLLFYGSDRFSTVSLSALLSPVGQKLVSSINVVTKPRCAVQKLSQDSGLPIHYWPYRAPVSNYDLGVVVSFGHLIPSSCIDACKYGMVNVHPSLLPRWRGPAPLVHTILNGDAKTGVSLITVAKNSFDTGILIDQRILDECPRTLEYDELEHITSSTGARMLLEFLSDVPGRLHSGRAQVKEGATKAPKVMPKMSVIDWKTMTAQGVDALRRAVANFQPLTTWYRGKKTKIFALPLNSDLPVMDESLLREKVEPGYIFYHSKRRLLAVRCFEGWAWVDSVSIEGHRKMTATDFNAGFLKKSHVKWFSDGTDV